MILAIAAAFVAGSILTGSMAFAGGPKTLETECAAKKGTIEAFLCEAISDLKEQVANDNDQDPTNEIQTPTVTERKTSVTVNAGPNAVIKSISCSSGEVLTGGGWKAISTGNKNVVIITDGPAEDNKSWVAQARHSGITQDSFTLQIFAMCLKLQ